MMANHLVVKRGKNSRYIIIVLKDNLRSINGLPREIKPYLRSHTYIDATKNTTDLVMKKLRYAVSFLNLL